MTRIISSIWDVIGFLKEGPQSIFDGNVDLMEFMLFSYIGIMSLVYKDPSGAAEHFKVAFSAGWPFLIILVLAAAANWVKRSIR